MDYDFSVIKRRIKPGKIEGELLIKAARMKNHPAESLRLVDGTAGLGEDSFLLAAYGFNVLLIEKNPNIFKSLNSILSQAALDEDLSLIVKRMELVEGDSIDLLRNLDFTPDIIYLDPMFPKRKKSGLVKKKMQMLQELEEPCQDEEGLLESAIYSNPHKIVIKRPAKGPFLCDRKPSYSIKGDIIRYDCIVFPDRR